MSAPKRRFGPYEAEMFPNEDRPGFNCFVTHTASGVSNSLAVLQDMGEFDEVTWRMDAPVKISQGYLDQIEEWALANGY